MDQQQNQNQSVSINVASSDPVLEQRIFNKVASAGRQLARMADVMAMLVDDFESVAGESISEKQRDAIAGFREMRALINKEKAEHTADYILRQIDTLQQLHVEEYNRVMELLRDRLEAAAV